MGSNGTRIAQITERGYPVAEVSKRLGVSPHSLYAWKKKFSRHPGGDDKDAEIRRLKRELTRVHRGTRHPKKSGRVFRQGCKVRYAFVADHRPLVRSVRADVPLPAHPTKRLLCLAEESAQQAGEGRRPPRPKLIKKAWRDSGKVYELSQAARRSAGSGRDLLPEPRCPTGQAGRHQGSDRLQAPTGQSWRKAIAGRRQHLGPAVSM